MARAERPHVLVEWALGPRHSGQRSDYRATAQPDDRAVEQGLGRSSAVLRITAIFAAIGLVACGAPARSPQSVPSRGPSVSATAPALSDDGVTVAQNVGPTLVVLSLDPGEPGQNALRVDLRDARGAAVAGTVRVALSLDGNPVATVALPAEDRSGTLTVPRAGHAELVVSTTAGPAAGSSVTFAMDLPVARVASGTLAEIDAATAKLHTMREAQTLTGGGPVLLFHFEYEAPDRVRYTTISTAGLPQETRLIGRDRFDRETDGPWVKSDIGFGSKVPSSAFAPRSTRVRLIGREGTDGAALDVLAFVQNGFYYTVWAGETDHLARRYTMMAKGHYMTGVYSDFDAPLSVVAP